MLTTLLLYSLFFIEHCYRNLVIVVLVSASIIPCETLAQACHQHLIKGTKLLNNDHLYLRDCIHSSV